MKFQEKEWGSFCRELNPPLPHIRHSLEQINKSWHFTTIKTKKKAGYEGTLSGQTQLEIIGKQGTVQKSFETTRSQGYFPTAPSNFLPQVKWFQGSPAQNYLRNIDANRGKLLGLGTEQPVTPKEIPCHHGEWDASWYRVPQRSLESKLSLSLVHSREESQ